ncbi:L,D-transpeptidase [Jatrophihabitans sp.]|uniref:L,D-transpeptidase n=1 Tax=Jatrophihabitans sp. TaxID=1932789 RepID=UPI002C23D58F|nr:Ig-like domain-containing protein [Jatrophihabitans sp.]
MAGYRDKTAAAVSLLLAAVLLTACSQKKETPDAAGGPNTGAPGTASASSSVPQTAPAVFHLTPASNATEVNPVTPVKIAVTGGSLSAVSLTNFEGKQVKGTLAADKQSWSSAEVLGYDRSYRLQASAVNPAGQLTTSDSTFSTLKPANMTMPYIQTAAGGAVNPGVTFGVGQVVRVHFDEPIPDRKAAQAALSVQTVPAQVGAFSWLDDSNVYWRTKNYLKPGTKVTVTAKVYGKDFGNSLYGQADVSTWFRVGAKHVSIADNRNKMIKVYSNDKLVRTIPTSMGRDVRIPGDHGLIDLRTNSGPHVVVGGEKDIDMNSASFGLSKGENAYRTKVPVGVRISYDGEYVHWADWSVAQQGKVNVSHGCLNVSPANAYWFYDFSVPGDIVDVRNTGRTLAEWNSGYWNVSWAKWVADGAA